MNKKPDIEYVAKAAIISYEDGNDKYDALAQFLRTIADELGYCLFLPGNDARVIDTSIVYEVANKLETLKND